MNPLFSFFSLTKIHLRTAFLILLGICFVIPQYTYAQPWNENLPDNKTKGELTFFDYQSAFYQYWEPLEVDNGFYFENGTRRKAPGWRQFKRWEYYMEAMVDPHTGAFPVKSGYEIHQEFHHNGTKTQSGFSGDWSVKGPASSTGGYAGIGRLNCIAFHPTNNNMYWVGAASGGIWFTSNNGNTWTCLSDENAVLAVSDIVIPSDFVTSQTIYIATGDKNAWDNRSVGVLKSTNGGQTWSTTGISYPISDFNMVSRILINPTNNSELIAATSSGVYKTINGGLTWNTQLTTQDFVDMEYQPGNWNVMLGSTDNGKIFRSVNAGISWSQVFSDGNAYRTELAVTPANSNIVYAVSGNSSSGLYGIFRSINGGQSFTMVLDGDLYGNNLLGWDAYGGGETGQAWYDLCIAASPSNANTVLVGGINTWRSSNGGSSFSIVNHWWGDGVQAVHADKHFLAFRNNGDLFECNDGGIYLSTDNGTTWVDKTNGMEISQIYKLGVSQSVLDETITGLQDNGSKLNSGSNWSDVKGGDGMECIIDYSNNNIQYATYVNGQISRTTNYWSSSVDIEPNGYPGAWVTPYIIHPTNPQILYAGYSNVWKTTNRGNSWVQISSMNSSDNLRSMAISPSNPQVLYVADNTNIWKTTNDGGSWTNITGSLPASSGYIRYISVKNDDSNTLWVGLSGYSVAGVYQSTNGGSSWTNISNGLPNIPVWCVIQNKQITNEIHLYAGTEVGVYIKKGNNDWTFFNNGLPNVKIGELEIYYSVVPSQSKLRAATYGRGLWETNVFYYEEDMEFLSATCFQDETSPVSPSSVNQEIMRIELSMQGNINALIAETFNFTTNGSDNPSQNLLAAKLHYSGSNNSFQSATQIDSTIPLPNGSFQFNPSQTLSDGVNYFWLSYDITNNASIGNFIDAELLSVMVDSLYIPAITNPIGNREIQINYCDATGGAGGSYEYINFFSFHTIENGPSGEGQGFYQDFTQLVAAVYRDSTYSFSVSIGSAYPSDQVRIWVDWNRDGDFNVLSELAYESPSGVGPFSGLITIPANAPTGVTRLRVRLWDAGNSNINGAPCGTELWGEVEDYSIEILEDPSVQTIDLPAGWSIFSSYIIPIEPNIADICQDILPSLVIVKNSTGSSYWPQWSVNTIGNIQIGEGYQIKLSNLAQLLVFGEPVIPESTPLFIPQGWSFLGYLRQSSIDIAVVLATISSEIAIVKSSSGQSYWPIYQINTIGMMNPGEGYQILMNAGQNFSYPAN